jgi:glycerophosphoryl diester phosphodiesterase
MLVIAHRGASFDAPENTLAAVRLAWQQQADAVEMDVHLTRDGKLVAIHDHTTRRTCGTKGKVATRNLAQLRKLDAGNWKGAQWRGERIPMLEEVLETVPSGKRLFIEIKCRKNAAPALEKAFVSAKVQSNQIVLIGFSFRAMKSLKRFFPETEVCWIAELKRHPVTRRWPDADRLARKIKAAGLNGLDLRANAAITPAFIKKIHSAGLKLYVWTVDTLETAEKLAQAGVDGITTNRPGWLRSSLDQSFDGSRGLSRRAMLAHPRSM